MLPAMDIFIVPFLITEVDVIEKAVNGDVGDRLKKLMQSKGVMPLMWLLQTRTNLYSSNEKLLLLPADFKGKKMRGTSKIMNLGSEALGAATMPVSGPEVYQALQRGTLDIGLTGVDAAFARHIYEVQKFGTVANTFSVVHPVIVNPAFWGSLPPEAQTAIREAAAIIQKKTFASSEAAKETAIRELGKKMTIHVQTKPEEDAWKAVMAKPVLDHFIERTGKDGAELAELIQKIKR
jgi:C4-dicarboxylate-binding protein DctP